MYTLCTHDDLNVLYIYIAGYFRGANISRLAVLVNFAENIFVDLVSNTTAGYDGDAII